MKAYRKARTDSSSQTSSLATGEAKRGRFVKFQASRFGGATKFKNSANIGVGFPRKMTQSHRYSDLVNLSGASGAAANFVFCANGMYDPNITGTGHQPLYFDQMSAIYNHYTVIGSKITITAVPFTATSESWCLSLAQNDDGSVTTTSPTGQSELANSSFKIVPANSNSQECTLVNKWSAKGTFGGSVLGNDNLQGSSGANPTEVTNWIIALRATDSTSTVSVYIKVLIEFIAVWEELKDIAQS